MSAVLLLPPTSEPLSLTEAKQFLRIEHADDDAVITALVTAARHHVEALTRRALMLQTWRLVLDAWPRNGRVTPRIGPLRTLTAARVYDAAGDPHVIDSESFVIDTAAHAIAAPCWAVPAPGRSHAGLELDVVCGYGTLASDVPADLRQAMRLLLAQWYEHRAALPDAGASQPAGVTALTAPYRMVSL